MVSMNNTNNTNTDHETDLQIDIIDALVCAGFDPVDCVVEDEYAQDIAWLETSRYDAFREDDNDLTLVSYTDEDIRVQRTTRRGVIKGEAILPATTLGLTWMSAMVAA